MAKTKYNRLSVTFSESAYRILENLQKDTGKSKAEILRLSLALLSYAEDKKKNSGESLAIVKDGHIKQEIIIP